MFFTSSETPFHGRVSVAVKVERAARTLSGILKNEVDNYRALRSEHVLLPETANDQVSKEIVHPADISSE